MNLRFENDVKMYGTQAGLLVLPSMGTFENDVKMYGTQAVHVSDIPRSPFENDVKMYGTQAVRNVTSNNECLRMM